MAVYNERAKAKEDMINSVRDLCSLKLKIPCGNPNLKLLHTNQFLFTELPSEVFELANMGEISNALNSGYSRFSGYQLNRWYIEGVTITNDRSNFNIELECNPFASSLLNYQEDVRSFSKTYEDAVTAKENAEANKNNENDGGVASADAVELPGGEGKYIDKLTKKVVGNEEDLLKRSKKIHNHLLKNLKYSFYRNSKFNSAEKAYKHKRLNCADTSRVNASMHRSAGVECYVVHLTKSSIGHYYLVVKAYNQLYCSDPIGGKRKYNYYWSSYNSNNKFKGKSSYQRKCGDNPCS